MIRIKGVTLREIHLPLVEPFQISSGTETIRRILLLEAEDVDGTIGWGECVASAKPNYNPENIDTAWLALTEWILPVVIGPTFPNPEYVYPMLNKRIRGHEMARASIEMAIWDIWARQKEVSLATVLGGVREKVATGISVGIQQSPAHLVEKIKGYLAEGYQRIKIKIKPGFDLPFVKAVREAFGDSIPLMVDANNAYSLDDTPLFQELDRFNLMMIEQPLDHTDIVRHATLQRKLKTPICLDESITKVTQAEDMIALGSGQIINIKPGRVGGFTSAKAIHDVALKAKIPVWCGGMLESGIGRAHNVALASLKNFSLPGDISPSSRYWEEDIVSPAWTMDENGMIQVPYEKPGIGVDVDMNKIEDLTVRRHFANSKQLKLV